MPADRLARDLRRGQGLPDRGLSMTVRVFGGAAERGWGWPAGSTLDRHVTERVGAGLRCHGCGLVAEHDREIVLALLRRVATNQRRNAGALREHVVLEL